MLFKNMERNIHCSGTRDFLSHFRSLPAHVKYQDILEALVPGMRDKPGDMLHSLSYTDDSGKVHPWPISERAKDYITPLTHLLTEIQSKLKQTYPKLQFVYFFAYNRLMADHVRSADELKPNALATISLATNEAPWRDVLMPIRITSNEKMAWIQCASYAEAMFASRPGRVYAAVVMFNHHTSWARFIIYSRSGISSTLPLDLSKVGGFRSFVRIIVHFLCSIDDTQDASQDSNFLLLPGYLTQVLSVVYTRSSLVGRATRVVRAKVVQTIDDSSGGYKSKEGHTAVLLSFVAPQSSRSSSRSLRPAQEQPQDSTPSQNEGFDRSQPSSIIISEGHIDTKSTIISSRRVVSSQPLVRIRASPSYLVHD